MKQVNYRVFGTYTWGKLKGKVNPSVFVDVLLTDTSVRNATSKINKLTGGALHSILGVKEVEEVRYTHI